VSSASAFGPHSFKSHPARAASMRGERATARRGVALPMDEEGSDQGLLVNESVSGALKVRGGARGVVQAYMKALERRPVQTKVL
jgi:hypothetical protein